MASAKITKRCIEALSPRARAFAVYDTELKGFGVRVMPSGLVSYIVEYRPGHGGRKSQKKRMTLGRAGELTPDQARELARDFLGEVRHGGDPLADRQAKRREGCLADFIETWAEENPPGRRTGRPMRAKTLANTLARLRHHAVPILGRKRLSEITTLDVNDFIARVARGETAVNRASLKKRGRIKVRGGPGAARKVAGDLSLVLGHAVERGIINTNPVTPARKPSPGKRHDFLTEQECERLGAALRALEAEGANPSGIACIRLMLLTGARPSEIEALKWSEVDLEGRCLRLGESKTGFSNRPVSQAAIDVISSLTRNARSPYVFPATRGLGHYCGSKKIWVLARNRAELPGRVRYHARHALASHALARGIDIATVAALLGHKNPRTTLSTYAHVLNERVHDAADAIGSKIFSMINKSSNSPTSGE